MIKIDVPLIQNAGEMLELACQLYNIPVKELAIDLGCSLDAIYSAFNGKRNLPNSKKEKISNWNLMAFGSVIMEVTKTKLFSYQKINRDIQSLLVGVQINNDEVDEILDRLPKLLWNKNCRQDLSEKDIEVIELLAQKTVESSCAKYNLLMEIEKTYKLNLVKYFFQDKKEKPPAVTSRRQLKKLLS